MALPKILQQLSKLSQESFWYLTNWKEQTLKKFFRLPYVAPIFKYISPNNLCHLRILAGIFILFLYLRSYHTWMFPIFIIAVLCDFIDGPLARSTGQVTKEGANLDPIADKVLISIPLFVIGIDQFQAITVSMFLMVEALLILTANFLKPYLRQKLSIPLASGANAFGQIKMVIQSIAVGLILLNPANKNLLAIGEWLIWICIGFGILSFLRHLARMEHPVTLEKRIITLPNLITLSSLFLFIPAGFALARENWWTAGIIIGWILISDWLDGQIARRFNQQTTFGAIIDPVRDFLARIFMIIWAYLLINVAAIHITILLIGIVEIITGIVNVSMSFLVKEVSLPNRWGKLRTFIHFVLLSAVFLHCFKVYAFPDPILITIFGTMFLFSIFALIAYVDQRRRLLNERTF